MYRSGAPECRPRREREPASDGQATKNRHAVNVSVKPGSRAGQIRSRISHTRTFTDLPAALKMLKES